jgi:hypothetical protein
MLMGEKTLSETEVAGMQTQTNDKDTNFRNQELDEELAGILTAISVVSKRLAKKLLTLQQQDISQGKGGNPDGQDE